MHKLITNDSEEPERLGHPIRDIIDRLPPEARERLRALRLARDEASAASRAILDQFHELDDQRRDIERQKRVRVMAYGEGQSRDAIKAAEAEIARLKAEVDRLASPMAARSERAATFNALVEKIERWLLRDVPFSARIVDLVSVVPALRRGEHILDAIEARRRRVRELKADHERFKAVPLPSSEAKARARQQIDELAARGAPNVAPLIERREMEFTFPRTHTHNRDGSFKYIDMEAVLAWLHRDALVAAVEQEIDAVADDENAMTEEQRAEKLAEIAADLLATEQEEARLCEVATAEGAMITPRKDIAPAAVLGVQIEAPAREN